MSDLTNVVILARIIAEQLEARFDAGEVKDSNIKQNVDDANELACILHLQRKDRSEFDDLANLLAHALFERVAIRQIFYRAFAAERKRIHLVNVMRGPNNRAWSMCQRSPRRSAT